MKTITIETTLSGYEIMLERDSYSYVKEAHTVQEVLQCVHDMLRDPCVEVVLVEKKGECNGKR